jgi:hypothetical protein
VALASGVLGSAGATFAWLAWIGVRVHEPGLYASAVIGAIVGLAAHTVQTYVKVARRENRGESVPPHASLSHSSLMAAIWTLGGGFLGLVAEHVVTHVATEFLQPFLASLATLLPAGVILGWTMSRGKDDDNLLLLIANGAITGIAIALVTGALWLLAFGTAPWFPLLCWWGLVGIGMRIVTHKERFAVGAADPIVAVVIVFALTFLLNLLPDNRDFYDHLGALGAAPMMLKTMAEEIQSSPAVPATFWTQAEREFTASETGDSASAPTPATPRVTNDTALTAANLQHAVDELTLPDSTPHGLARAVIVAPGSSAEFIRSWLVILLFAIGVGAAPWVERTLRPADYPRSETYRKDIILANLVGAGLLGLCVVARLAHVGR